MKTIKLITNSDDFGLTNSITDAIIDTHVNGIMTSTTMMSNMEGFNYAVIKAKEYTSLGIGIHFNLTEGKPLTESSKIPDLIDQYGNFNSNAIQRRNFIFGKNKFKQIELELENQLLNLLDNSIVPTHFDSHHHITGVPLAFRASFKVAKKFNISKARITNVDYLYCPTHKISSLTKLKNTLTNAPKGIIHSFNKSYLRRQGFLTPETKILPGRVLPFINDPVEQFIQTLRLLKPGVTEISFHPGYVGSDPNDSKKTADLRLRDLQVANSPEVKNFITENNIKLINFNAL